MRENNRTLEIVFSPEPLEENPVQHLLPLMIHAPFRHFRGKPPGGNGIDLNSILCPFHRKIFGKSNDSPFAGAIRDGIQIIGISSYQTSIRDDIDNLSTLLLDHLSPDLLTE